MELNEQFIFTRTALECQNIRTLAALAVTKGYRGHKNDKGQLIEYLANKPWDIPREFINSYLVGAYLLTPNGQEQKIFDPSISRQPNSYCNRGTCTVIGYGDVVDRLKGPPSRECFKDQPIRTPRRQQSMPIGNSPQAQTVVNIVHSPVARPAPVPQVEITRGSSQQELLRQRVSRVGNEIRTQIAQLEQIMANLDEANTSRGWFTLSLWAQISTQWRLAQDFLIKLNQRLDRFTFNVYQPFYEQLKRPYAEGVITRARINDAIEDIHRLNSLDQVQIKNGLQYSSNLLKQAYGR